MAKKSTSTSTSGSRPAHRFAHPFYSSTPISERTPIAGDRRMTDWSKKQLGPVPSVMRGGTMTLADVIGADSVKEVEDAGEIRFHALGDSGFGSGQEAETVGESMVRDYSPDGGGANPAFLFHLGDVLYGNDKEGHYTDRFYRPYRHYPGKIIAIPGNHDGEVRNQIDSPSLSGFQENFCQATPGVPTAASAAGIYREMIARPGVYWLLDAPFVRIIGLYSNLLENPGYLEGKENGTDDTSQVDWLTATLKSISKQPKKALVVATHHPPYSAGGHAGSTEMNDQITQICGDFNLLPDLYLAAHAHNYQRYTRTLNRKKITYIVAGTGGMAPQPLPVAGGEPFGKARDVTYDKAMSKLGYLYVTVSRTNIRTEFWPVDHETTPFDAVDIPLA